MPDYVQSQLGAFLRFETWEDALNLLNFQISQMNTNRHFNTLSMYYYRKLGNAVSAIKAPNYFETKIANNLFYGLNKEFATIQYLVPRAGLGIRSYKFLTYPMRAIYYALGLYLLKLSDEFLTEYATKRNNVHSYYGGKLVLEKGRLSLSSNSVYYRNHYLNFRKQIRSESDGDVSDKVIIRLDIQNYFDEISIPILLDRLQQSIKPGIIKECNFTISTIEQIPKFFGHLSDSGVGIPQADNDIISNFIGYLYMTFGDLIIDDLLRSQASVIESHTITRFVDDFYIAIKFKKNVPESEREACIGSIGASIADHLYYKLHLRLNPKTRFYWLSRKDDAEDFRASVKKVSLRYQVGNDENDEPPETKLENIFRQLDALKHTKIGSTFDYEKSIEEEILREVFDKRVEQLIAKPEYLIRIRDLFEGFNFDLVKVTPTEVTIIILKDPTTATHYAAYLQNLKSITTKDADLIIHFLCQTGFKDEALLKKLQINISLREIIDTYLKADLSLDTPGYYGLHAAQVLKLSELAQIIDQIQLRAMSEKINAYSVALNHLLNEIHSICWNEDVSKRALKGEEYTAEHVVQFLSSRGLPHEHCIKIRNLFDRRNKNQVSHPGSQDRISWAVTSDEYEGYRFAVGECLSYIL